MLFVGIRRALAVPVTVPPTIVPPFRYHEPVVESNGSVVAFVITPVIVMVVAPVCCTANACAVVNVPPRLIVDPDVVIVPEPVLLHAPPNVNVPLAEVTPPIVEFVHAPLPPTVSAPPDAEIVPLLLPVPLLSNVTVLPLFAMMIPLLLHEPDDVRLTTLPVPALVALSVPVFVQLSRFSVIVPPPSLAIVPLLISVEPP